MRNTLALTVTLAFALSGCESGVVTDPTDGGRRDARADARADATTNPDGAMSACPDGRTPMPEVCDGQDNDCNGMIDETCPCAPGMRRECYGGPLGTVGTGACRAGLQSCDPSGLWGRCENQATPGAERCDGVDNDCDGMTDEGCECRVGFTRGCYSGAMGTSGVGACREGVQSCEEEPDGTTAWGPCMGMVAPGGESCNGVDDNCDGRIDEGCTCMIGQTRPCYSGPMGTAGVGACRNGMQTCVMNAAQMPEWGGCSGSVTPVAERCDAIDNDCNGRADESCLCAPGQTATYRQRDLRSMSLRSDIQPGDGAPIMPMTCEMRRCPDGQVAVQTSPATATFACVPPPPTCPAGQHATYVAGGWRCSPPCEVLITYGYLYGGRVVCAPRPRLTCGSGQTPTFVYETETWQCRPTCDNGQYDIRTFMGAIVCVPC